MDIYDSAQAREERFVRWEVACIGLEMEQKAMASDRKREYMMARARIVRTYDIVYTISVVSVKSATIVLYPAER